MKEEYVTYEQAVKLKKLGFDWSCYHYYESNKRLVESKIYSQTFKVSEYWCNFNEDEPNRHRQPFYPHYSAPRLDQAQKWLRDKHNLSVELICNMVRQWNVNVCKIDNFGTPVYSKMNFDTYELALTAGINAVLELLTDKLNDK